MDDFHGWLSWMTLMDDFLGWLSWILHIDRQTDRHCYSLSCYRNWNHLNYDSWWALTLDELIDIYPQKRICVYYCVVAWPGQMRWWTKSATPGVNWTVRTHLSMVTIHHQYQPSHCSWPGPAWPQTRNIWNIGLFIHWRCVIITDICLLRYHYLI